AESPANRCRNDADVALSDPADRGDALPVHIRRLCAGLNFHAVSQALREARFGFDASVLDKTGFELAVDYYIRFGKCFVHVAAYDTPAHKNIVRSLYVHSWCVCRQRSIHAS